MEKILITGSAGFIGFHASKYFLERNYEVLGIDSITEYYDRRLKLDRNNILKKYTNYNFKKMDLTQSSKLKDCVERFRPNVVLHLAAQAGVRYSLSNPRSYLESNIVGTFNILEAIKEIEIKHFLMASTSSIYDSTAKMPFSELSRQDFQLSFYAASKKSGEVITHSYSALHDIPTTCFRFFTVYGPWGRPDMALFKFTESILKGETVNIHNFGNMERDFTFIDDLVKAIYLLSKKPPSKIKNNNKKVDFENSPSAKWRVINIGRSEPQKLMVLVEMIEEIIGLKLKKNFVEIQPGEIKKTYADNSILKKIIGYTPDTDLKEGIASFIEWYKMYFKI